MEIENEDEKSFDSFQGELDLVKEEEEDNRISQKERLAKIMEVINSTNKNKDENTPEENPQILRGANPNVLRAGQPNKTSSIQNDKNIIPEPFDPNFNLNEKYFFQNISADEWSEINNFINKFISENNFEEKDLEDFFEKHPKISKGNILKLQNSIEEIFSQKNEIKKYKILINFIIKKYFKPKPVICECYFFPNPSNEQRVVKMFQTCKKTLDIAIFTFTRDSIAQAILDAHKRGLKVRCIGDDGNSKVKGSDVRLLASVGIPCKTDNNARFHMHNKMAIIDNSVVITGSFNWTNQAINKNQDNILFIEDKNIANQYTKYFNEIWDSFDTVITKEEALKYIEDEKKAQDKKNEEKEKANKDKSNNEKKDNKKEEKENNNSKGKKNIEEKSENKKGTTSKEKSSTKKEKKSNSKEKSSIKKEKNKKTKEKTSTSKRTVSKEKKKENNNINKKETKEKSNRKEKSSTKVSKEKEKRSKTMKEKKKSSTVKTKEKTNKNNNKAKNEKAKATKEKKKEKVEKSKAKRKTKETKRVRGVKSNKSTQKKKK